MRSEAGFSLIEVMVTAFILGTGILGVAAMQGLATQSSFEAQQRTMAAFIASDIVERMRLNKAWINSVSTASYTVTSIKAASLSQPSCATSYGGMSGCSGEQVKEHDLFEWRQMLLGSAVTESGKNVNGLAGAEGCISNASSGVVTVIVAWNSRSSLLDAADASDELATGCGSASKKRRQLKVTTLIR